MPLLTHFPQIFHGYAHASGTAEALEGVVIVTGHKGFGNFQLLRSAVPSPIATFDGYLLPAILLASLI